MSDLLSRIRALWTMIGLASWPSRSPLWPTLRHVSGAHSYKQPSTALPYLIAGPEDLMKPEELTFYLIAQISLSEGTGLVRAHDARLDL